MRKFIKNSAIILASAAALFGAGGCNKFLDVVPDDGLATIETSFNLRESALKYLATCYAYMTHEGAPGPYKMGNSVVCGDNAMLTGDELWDLVGRSVSNTYARVSSANFNIARGLQSATTVYANDWVSMYQGIRCCDILCEHIGDVPDMTDAEKAQWIAEVKFLKAYYHFNLVRKWGPIPVIKESLPIDSDVETVRVYRDKIDDCFDFILQLLDEALPYLPLVNPNVDEYGRINQVICASFKARVAAYAASPLFNGNDEESSLVDGRGVQLFPAKSDEEKLARWKVAMESCEAALKLCDEANLRLYTKEDVKGEYRMTDSLATTLALRNAFCEKWNCELIWGNTQTSSSQMTIFQRLAQPILSDYTDMLGGYRFIGVPMKVADQFFTNHGLPIANDESWTGVDLFALKEGDAAHSYYIKKGYTTVRSNFYREPRFYASIGFDGGNWLGQLTKYNDIKDDQVLSVACRLGAKHGKTGTENGPVTGYFPKKMFPYKSTWAAANSFVGYWFPWPMIRLTDIYLLYAECINEYEGPDGAHSQDLFKYLDAVRDRAGIPDVKTSWDEYSNRPGYYSTKVGMRDIIHKERLNELAFESQRFWDLRRWKEASTEYQKNIYGFNISASSASDYYVKTLIARQSFGIKDYFWPIPTSYIETNPNLVQNIGW